MAKVKISDEDLEERVKIAISDGMTMHSFYYELRNNKLGVGERRLARFWKKCDGPVRDWGRW